MHVVTGLVHAKGGTFTHVAVHEPPAVEPEYAESAADSACAALRKFHEGVADVFGSFHTVMQVTITKA